MNENNEESRIPMNPLVLVLFFLLFLLRFWRSVCLALCSRLLLHFFLVELIFLSPARSGGQCLPETTGPSREAFWRPFFYYPPPIFSPYFLPLPPHEVLTVTLATCFL